MAIDKKVIPAVQNEFFIHSVTFYEDDMLPISLMAARSRIGRVCPSLGDALIRTQDCCNMQSGLAVFSPS
jgi:hypothetical protein